MVGVGLEPAGPARKHCLRRPVVPVDMAAAAARLRRVGQLALQRAPAARQDAAVEPRLLLDLPAGFLHRVPGGPGQALRVQILHYHGVRRLRNRAADLMRGVVALARPFAVQLGELPVHAPAPVQLGPSVCPSGPSPACGSAPAACGRPAHPACPCRASHTRCPRCPWPAPRCGPGRGHHPRRVAAPAPRARRSRRRHTTVGVVPCLPCARARSAACNPRTGSTPPAAANRPWARAGGRP